MEITEKQIRQIIREVIEEGFMGDLKGLFSKTDKVRQDSIHNMLGRVIDMPPNVTDGEMYHLKRIYQYSSVGENAVNLHEMTPEQQKAYALKKLKRGLPEHAKHKAEYLSEKFPELVRFYDIAPKGPFFE